jgi:hypothetical protein
VAKAKAKPKYSAAAFRRLVAKLAAKAEASAARVEAQIKEICDLVSPGFGDRFIDLFRNQWRSREDANEYLLQRNRILVWLDEFAAARRKPYIEKARQEKLIATLFVISKCLTNIFGRNRHGMIAILS